MKCEIEADPIDCSSGGTFDRSESSRSYQMGMEVLWPWLPAVFSTSGTQKHTFGILERRRPMRTSLASLRRTSGLGLASRRYSGM